MTSISSRSETPRARTRAAPRATLRRTLPARALALTFLLGCGTATTLGPVEEGVGGDDVLDTIQQRVEAHGSDLDGKDRWALESRASYQEKKDIEFLRRHADAKRKRAEEARRLAEAGPLTLETCMAFSLEFNDSLQAARAALKSYQGDALIARSRFIPQLAYTMSNTITSEDGEKSSHSFDNLLRLSQTLVEFGRENGADVAIRAAARDALFTYENAVRNTLSDLRRKFFTILLRKQQIDERKKLLKEFQERYEKIYKLEQARRVLEVDVLTARLNVLNEEARINALDGEMLRQKIDLLHLIGFPVEMTDTGLAGSFEQLDLALDQAVEIGLMRSTAIAQARSEVAEQIRVVREVGLRNGVDLSARAGNKTDRAAAGLEFNTDDGLYSLSGFAEQHLQDRVDSWDTGDSTLNSHGPGWSADVSLSVPLFDGFKRRGEYLKQRARLLEALHSLRERIDLTEAEIRKSYQTLLERRKELEILKETVNISKERLRVQERYKELGRITDNELETFRNRFFADQDSFFQGQISLMQAQESLRHAVRHFEPLTGKASESIETTEEN